MSVPEPTSYDQVPYDSHPFPQTHPGRLAALGALFGMQPAPVPTAQVLELGCASGGNLIPMAVAFPEARFLGVDLSARQIEAGLEEIAALGLENIELRHTSITDIGPDIGCFDYILCHGVFSWVPDAVRDHILQICRDNLAENGIAYVSYNTYPGWHMRGMIRDMMRYHCGQFADPGMQVGQARALLDFLSNNAPTRDGDPYGLLLKRELDLLRGQRDSYLFHEHLEAVNEPLYFHQFIERAQARGLQYLAEAEFSAMLARNFPAAVAETLYKIAPGIVAMEQYMDFLRNRMFRQTLLVHQETPLKRNLTGKDVQGFYMASPAKTATEAGYLRNSEPLEFRGPGGQTLTTRRPITKAAMLVLQEHWPEAMHFEDLVDHAVVRLGGAGHDERALATTVLADDLLQGFSCGLMEFHLFPSSFRRIPGDHPAASPLARRQAARGRVVTNLRHENVTLDDATRQILVHVDGRRTAEELTEVVAELIGGGSLNLAIDGQPVTDPERIMALSAQAVRQVLPRLGNAALLLR